MAFKTSFWPGFTRLRAVAAGLCLVALLFAGCSESVNTYHAANADKGLAASDRVLVLPFLDARTFTDPNDPYRENLGEHAREIFTAELRENPAFNGAVVDVAGLPRRDISLAIAEVAEIGKNHGADYVVAGQIFSFTETRAASIPPRAGMFVRIVSVRDGALVFVGDHYQAAAIPGAPGGRELQAKQVAARLIDSFAARLKTTDLARANASLAAYAFIPAASRDDAGGWRGNDGAVPEPPPPLPDFAANPVFAGDAPVTSIPDVPVVLEYESDDDFFTFAPAEPVLVVDAAPAEVETAETPVETPAEAGSETLAVAENDMETAVDAGSEMDGVVLLPPPSLDEIAAEFAEAEDEPAREIADLRPPRDDRLDDDFAESETVPEDEADVLQAAIEPDSVETAEIESDAVETAYAESADEPDGIDSADVEPAVEAWMMSGDELAADLFEAEGAYDLMLAARSRQGSAYENLRPQAEAAQSEARDDVQAEAAEVAEAVELAEAVETAEAAVDEPESYEQAEAPAVVEAPAEAVAEADGGYRLTQRQYFEAMGAGFPDDSTAIVVTDDALARSFVPSGAISQPTPAHAVDMVVQDADRAAEQAPQVEYLAAASRRGGEIKVLVLPYHERDNPDNLIPHTGGGEVVTALFGAKLAMEPGLRVLWSGGDVYTHRRLASIEEAVAYGRSSGVDYVVRGQVVEFRRAQSVPSFYSAVISTVVLAAQIFFAEMSGVDVATEVYRVSDGMCVMSRRDRSQQKYVVQAEKTVRKIAAGMAGEIAEVIKDPSPAAMEPLINDLATTSMLSSLR